MRTRISKADALALQESMQVLANETTKRHLELLHLRRKGDLLVKPVNTDLHVWQLEVTRRIVGWGHTSNSEYTLLFLTRDLAFEGAAEEVMSTYEGRDVWDKEMLKLYQEKKFEEFAGYVSSRFSEWDFKVRCVSVKADGKRRPICEYEEGEEDDDRDTREVS